MKKENEKICEEKRRDCTIEEPSGRKNMLGGVKKTHVCLDNFLTWGARMPPSIQIQQSYFLRGEVWGDKDMGSLGVCRLEKGPVESLSLNHPACGLRVKAGDGGGPLNP